MRAFTINPALPLGLLAGLMFSLVSCTGIQMGQKLSDICACVPTSPPIDDHRHDAKHIPLPVQTPQEITVNTILSWPIDPDLLPADAPREGRELTLFHIRHAFLQRIKVEHNDCDIHFEISNTPDKTARRVIVETPVDSEYCPRRRNIQQQLAQHNIIFNGGPLELSPALPVDIVGLAFEDFQHAGRGSNAVATIWELHPAIVQLTQ